MPFVLEGPDPYPAELTATPIAVDPPDLLDDLPPFEQSSRDIQGVVTAIGNELARVEAARQELIQNFFPASADALLHFYEAMLSLPVDSPADTLLARQTTVLAFMQQLKSAGSGVEWVEAITKLVGTGWSFALHDPSDPDSIPPPYTILIRVPYQGAVSTPAGLSGSESGAGSLDIENYWYGVSALTVYGETLTCTPVVVSVADSGSAVHLTWTNEGAPVIGYNIYRGLGADALAYVGTTTGHAFTDTGVATPGDPAPTVDTSASPQAVTVKKLARQISPAHMDVQVGYTTGFLVGISLVGIDAL